MAKINPMRYRGYYVDNETGFFYVGSRYYDPNTCRFLNADEPAMLGLSTNNLVSANLFAYCNNNPVMYSDPTGMCAAAISLSTPAFYAFVEWLSAIAAADWWNPVGWVLAAVLAAGVITWAAVSYYHKYQEKVIDKIEQKVPSKLKLKDGRIDLRKFNNSNGPKLPKGGRGKLGPMGWYIAKDLDNHKGSIWKLFNWAGERIASLASDGTIVGK